MSDPNELLRLTRQANKHRDHVLLESFAMLDASCRAGNLPDEWNPLPSDWLAAIGEGMREKDKKIAELEAENGRLKEESKAAYDHYGSRRERADEIARLRTEVERLRAQIQANWKHTPDCVIGTEVRGLPCSCGLPEALDTKGANHE